VIAAVAGLAATVGLIGYLAIQGAATTDRSDLDGGVAASAAPVSVNDCPTAQPIKGNIRTDRGTRLYQIPGSPFYAATNPEVCFRDIDAAVSAGFSAPPAP
jgi:hypothetical protein